VNNDRNDKPGSGGTPRSDDRPRLASSDKGAIPSLLGTEDSDALVDLLFADIEASVPPEPVAEVEASPSRRLRPTPPPPEPPVPEYADLDFDAPDFAEPAAPEPAGSSALSPPVEDTSSATDDGGLEVGLDELLGEFDPSAPPPVAAAPQTEAPAPQAEALAPQAEAEAPFDVFEGLDDLPPPDEELARLQSVESSPPAHSPSAPIAAPVLATAPVLSASPAAELSLRMEVDLFDDVIEFEAPSVDLAPSSPSALAPDEPHAPASSEPFAPPNDELEALAADPLGALSAEPEPPAAVSAVSAVSAETASAEPAPAEADPLVDLFEPISFEAPSVDPVSAPISFEAPSVDPVSAPISFESAPPLSVEPISIAPLSLVPLSSEVSPASVDLIEAPASIPSPMGEAPKAALREELPPASIARPRPAMPPKRSERPALASEREASLHLSELGVRDAWVERARWFREEAAAQTDNAARGRLLLHAAELCASCGEYGQARELLLEAREAAPTLPLVHAGLRGLLVRDSDFEAAFEALEHEERAAQSAEQRAHAALFASEIARLKLNDAEAAARKLDVAQRTMAADPRAPIQRLALALAGGGDAAAKARLPADLACARLQQGAAEVVALRRPTATSSGGVAVAVAAARASFAAGDASQARAHLHTLVREPELAGAAGWLLAAWQGVETPTDAIDAAARGSHGQLTAHLRADRALASGDMAKVRDLTGQPEFSPAEQLALAALAGEDDVHLREWVDTLGAERAHTPLAVAAAAVAGLPSAPPLLDTGLDARLVLGRALARAASSEPGPLHTTLQAAADAVRSTDATPIAHVLDVELELERGQPAALAERLLGLPKLVESHDTASILAGAMLADLGGDEARPVTELERARQLDPSSDSAARLAALFARPADVPRIVSDAASASEGERAFVLLIESAFRLSQQQLYSEADVELRRALGLEGIAPRLRGMSVLLGQRVAMDANEPDWLQFWLAAGRGLADDAVERSVAIAREGQFLAGRDAAAAEALLREGALACPDDVVLRELYERSSPELPSDTATWRRSQAARAHGREAQRLALEAALALEQLGDAPGALEAAAEAARLGEDALVPLLLERLARAGHGTQGRIDALMPAAREAADLDAKIDLYERLAALDTTAASQGAGAPSSGLVWHTALLEELPHHLPSLQRMESARIEQGRASELGGLALTLATQLGGGESVAHAWLARRLARAAGDAASADKATNVAASASPSPLWALRAQEAAARAARDPAWSGKLDRALLERTTEPDERAALALRAAMALREAGDLDGALACAELAGREAPFFLGAYLEQAAVHQARGDEARAASSFEEAAALAATSDERVRCLYEAGVLFERSGDARAARNCFEQAAALDLTFGDLFERLRSAYREAGAWVELAALLESRLTTMSDAGARVPLEVERGRILARVGEAAAAKEALRAALDTSAEHLDALSAFAEVCEADEDWEAAEDAWLRLARLAATPDAQCDVYAKLGALYEEHRPNAERAELAYKEILKRRPADDRARDRLVALYLQQGQVEKALGEARALLEAATTPEEKCKRNVELARVYEAAGEAKKAESVLVAARKNYPKDDRALEALARYYQRAGQEAVATALLERALGEAHRALATGRFEHYLFTSIATAWELLGRSGAGAAARAATLALDGADDESGAAPLLTGAGDNAASQELDELLAPELLSPELRTLLKATGPLLDSAVPYDLSKTVAPTPEQASLVEEAQAIAAAYGMDDVTVRVSAAVGSAVVPATSHPPTVVVGQALLAPARASVLTFLLHRAIKVLQLNAAPLARASALELPPLLGAYFKSLDPSYVPAAADPARLTEALGRITRAGGSPSAALGATAASVGKALGTRISGLGTATYAHGSRAALLATGDFFAAAQAIAWAGNSATSLPTSGKDRLTWIGRNAEARDLFAFAVSEAHVAAREKLGLG
jgi:tetratricopeptide (TPR) repeat protein